MKRHASATWNGGFKDGKGTVSSESGAFSGTPYNAKMRFEDEKGTNPEELIAAAHASCFSMALSLFLNNAGMNPQSIETKATVTLEKVGDAFTVTSSHLDTAVRMPGADPAAFAKAAEGAKAGCPISRLLAAAKITMTAKLV